MQMAMAVKEADGWPVYPDCWLQAVLTAFFDMDNAIEFEPFGCQHADIEYLYVVEGVVDHSPGAKRYGKLPVTISVYGIGCDDSYHDAEMREPIFSGTAYEYIERFGKEQ